MQTSKVDTSFTNQLCKLNYELMNLSQQYGNLFICNIAGLQKKFGRDFMFVSNVNVSTEMILSIAAVPYTISYPYGILDLEGRNVKCVLENHI